MKLREHIKGRIEHFEDLSTTYSLNLEFDKAQIQLAITAELYELIKVIDNNAYDEIGEKLK